MGGVVSFNVSAVAEAFACGDARTHTCLKILKIELPCVREHSFADADACAFDDTRALAETRVAPDMRNLWEGWRFLTFLLLLRLLLAVKRARTHVSKY